MASTREQLETLLLSAEDIRSKNPTLDETFVLDYLNTIRNLFRVATATDTDASNIIDLQQIMAKYSGAIQRNRGRINDNSKAINAVETEISNLRTDIYNFMPFKGYALKIKGVGAGNPTIVTSYNVASVVRTGAGVYQVTLNQGTILGASIANDSLPSADLDIATSATSAMYAVKINTFVGTTFNVNIFAVTVGVGTALALTPYDLQVTDTVSISGLMSILTGLPPV